MRPNYPITITNRFEGDCSACDSPVGAGEGFASKEHSRAPWRTYCRSCATRRGLRPKGEML